MGSARASAVCTSAVARPSARASSLKSSPLASSRSASSQPSVAPWTKGCSTPRTYVSSARSASIHAAGRRHPGAALAGPATSGSSRSGLIPGHDPPQQLQDERISVDDRGVGLLRRHQPRHQTVPDLLPRVPLEAQVADARPGAQRLQEHVGGPWRRAGPRTRCVRPAAPRSHVPDQRGREPWRQRLAYADQELVAVAPGAWRRPASVRAADAPVRADGAGPAAGQWQQLGGRHQREPGDRTALAREPALPWQPLAQQRIERREQLGVVRGGVATERVTASDMASRPFPRTRRPGDRGRY